MITKDEFYKAYKIVIQYQKQIQEELKMAGKVPQLFSRDKKLVDFDLSIRVLNLLKTKDIETLGELVNFNFRKLLGGNKKSITEIDEFLQDIILE